MATEEQVTYAKNQLGAVTTSNHEGNLKSTMEYYNTWAKNYEKHISEMGDNIGKTAVDRLNEMFPNKEGLKVIDCGCGPGYIGQLLHSQGFTDIDGVDGSSSMIGESKKRGVFGRLIHDFLGPNRLDIEDDTYDLLVSTGLFCSNHAKEDCLPEMIRIVKPGGKIYISTREINVLTDPHLSRYLEPAMKMHHDNGNWKWIKREIVPGYLGDWNGFVAIFEVL